MLRRGASPVSSPGTRARLRTAGVVSAVVVLKLVVILADPTIRLFLGDSAAYLDGARFNDRLPMHRSFVYSLFLRGLVRPTGSLSILLFWQSAAGVGVAFLLWKWLARYASLPRWLAAAAACALAVTPAQLFYERMVMAEALGLCAFAGFFVAGSAYVANGRVIWLPFISLLGLVAASLRLNYLPTVIVVSLALPLVGVLQPGKVRKWRSLMAHCLVVACSVGAGHGGYRLAVGAIFQVRPTYLPRAGFMRMSLVAPLIRPEHFARAGLPSNFAERLTYNLADPDTRQAQMWAPGGLTDALRTHTQNLEQTAAMLASLAVRDDPVGVVRLGLHTLGNYFRPIGHLELWADLGHREYPDALVRDLREHWGYDAVGLAFRMTPVSHYFAAGTAWLVVCLLLMGPAALLSVALHWRDPRRAQIVLGALFGVGLTVTHVLFVNLASYRYLQPCPFFAMVNVLPLAWTVCRRRMHSQQINRSSGGVAVVLPSVVTRCPP